MIFYEEIIDHTWSRNLKLSTEGLSLVIDDVFLAESFLLEIQPSYPNHWRITLRTPDDK